MVFLFLVVVLRIVGVFVSGAGAHARPSQIPLIIAPVMCALVVIIGLSKLKAWAWYWAVIGSAIHLLLQSVALILLFRFLSEQQTGIPVIAFLDLIGPLLNIGAIIFLAKRESRIACEVIGALARLLGEILKAIKTQWSSAQQPERDK